MDGLILQLDKVYYVLFFELTLPGARDLNLSSMMHGMYERGPVELVEYFVDKCNDRLTEELAVAESFSKYCEKVVDSNMAECDQQSSSMLLSKRALAMSFRTSLRGLR